MRFVNLSAAVVYFAIILIGIAVSALLLLGMTRLRWFLWVVAINYLVASIAMLALGGGKALKIEQSILLLISLITLVLLFGVAVNIFHF